MSRTYSQDEVAAILKEAYRLADGNAQENQGMGLTLAELESMAGEHGLDSATIRAAAARLDSVSEPETFRTYAGVRWRVGHRAMLSGTLSDAQWAAIVADCREQFQAQGAQTVEAGHRVWRNGNLFVSAEPTVDGARTVLHMGSRNDTIPGLMGGGLSPLILCLIFLTLALTGVEPDLLITAGILAPIGLGLVGAGVFVGRNWIQDRERQMALIADRAISRSGAVLGAKQEVFAPSETELGSESPLGSELKSGLGSELNSELDSNSELDPQDENTAVPRQRSRS